MKVAIIGAGTIGKATGIGLQRFKNDVIFYDNDDGQLASLSEQNYCTASNIEELSGCEIYMVCVNTPLLEESYDLRFLKAALVQLGGLLNKKRDVYQLVVIRSTVLPHTTRDILLEQLSSHCSLTLEKDYGVCYNPEFLRQDYALQDFLKPPIIVIGEQDKHSGDILESIYEPFKAPIARTSFENAEAIKCFSNAYSSMKVSFFNLLFLVSREAGLDHKVIERAMTRSSTGLRLRSYYTSGGRPFGGACFPKDLAALTQFVKSLNISPAMLESVAEINEILKKETPE